MRLNWETQVAAGPVVLRPYRRIYVPRYHEWMADEWLRDMTASERLTIDEERDAQLSWQRDPAKLTFLVFARPDAAAGAGDGGAGGGIGEGTAASAVGDGDLAMIGDVNLFLLDEDHADDYLEVGGEVARTTSSADAAGAATPPTRCAEVMVMIAEAAYRRRGCAAAAATAMMHYGACHLGLTTFVAKISTSNEASIALFGRLGFVEAKRIAAFEETHMVLGPRQGGVARLAAVVAAAGYAESRFSVKATVAARRAASGDACGEDAVDDDDEEAARGTAAGGGGAAVVAVA